MLHKAAPNEQNAATLGIDAMGILHAVVDEGTQWLGDKQREDGHWAFELEADATIPAEYILLNHYLGTIDDAVEQKLANYLRRIQSDSHYGWPLYHDGEFDMSCSVKAYLALKLVGDAVDAPHMQRARDAILARGGAAKANVFTRFTLAFFGQVPWAATPYVPVEALLLPKWAPFHADKVSYWSRTVMIPLMMVASMRPVAKNPRGVDVQELFTRSPWEEKKWLSNPTGTLMGELMLHVDAVARRLGPLLPKKLKDKALGWGVDFVRERLNGEDGLGGIFPAMANALMAFDALGYPADHPDVQICRKAIDKLLVFQGDEGYCQPCLSPVWDTGLALHALQDAGLGPADPMISNACDWLKDRQILDVVGDWSAKRPDVRPGGWAFQYWNDHYPDVDDTAVVVMALHRADPERYKEAIQRGTEWVIGMQSENGGWGAFDADNEYYFLQNIPFADHGALLDPPTADVSARCLSMLAQLGYESNHSVVAKGLEYLKGEQEEDGSWFGRWGTNYVYGTWSVLCALNALGEDMEQPYIRRAVDWLKSRQHDDGGWGEDCASYWQHRRYDAKGSTPSQTSWALLALMAAGEVESPQVASGIKFLLNAERNGGKWHEEYFNAVGFPRVFYLRYHGYSAYFPLWALARYRELKSSNSRRPTFGM